MLKKKLLKMTAALLAVSLALAPATPIQTASANEKAARAGTSSLWEDYAQGKTVYSTDEYWENYVVSNVTDGSRDTRWAPKATPSSLTIDLGSKKAFNRIALEETGGSLGNRIRKFTLSCSDEQNGTYTEFYQGTKVGVSLTVEFPEQKARYLKLQVTESTAKDGINLDGVKVYNTKSAPISEDTEWKRFLEDLTWQNELDINGVGKASLISNPDGGTLQLEVTERPYERNVTDQVKWSIDKPEIAELSPTGLVTAKKAGSVTVTARATINGTPKNGSLVIDILDKDATYKDNYDSLIANYKTPEWFRDAKFGIFVHWGVYSIPAYSSEWLPRNMYFDGDVKNTMISRYGALSEHGYKDFVPDFKAENYNPQEWAQLFQQAGAKYVVPVAEHHDGITMYDSDETRWSLAQIGPKRDVIKELQESVKKTGLKFGVSQHFMENQLYYQGGKKDSAADASDSRWFDLYNNGGECTADVADNANRWYTSAHLQNWYSRSKEVVDKIHPDLIYYDWTVQGDSYMAQFLSYYYNRAEETNPDGVVMNYKFNLPEGSAVFDIERGQSSGIIARPWQTDTSISDRSWGFIEGDTYKKPENLLTLLIDVVSKNGNLLLNIGPDGQGGIPDAARTTLEEMGRWLDVNGECIYGTRPWNIYGEGNTQVGGGSFAEVNNFDATDIRFTTGKDGKTLYAIGMVWPQDGKMNIKALKEGYDLSGLKSVSLLGSQEAIGYSQTESALSIDLPQESPNKAGYPYALKLEFQDKLPEDVLANATAIVKGNNWDNHGPDKALDKNEVTRWANKDENESTWMEISLDGKKAFDYFSMDEYIHAEEDKEIGRRLKSFTLSKWNGNAWEKFFDSEAGEGYTRVAGDWTDAKMDTANNLFRDKNGDILKNVHTASFQPVTTEKVRIDFQVNKELSLFEVNLSLSREGQQAVEKAEIDAVEALIKEIGEVSATDECKRKIDAARSAYDALSDSQKEQVAVYNVLTAAEARYEELKNLPVAKDLAGASIKAIPAQYYNGKAKKPSVTVSYGGVKLKKGTDYTLSYKNNTKIGTATVTIQGIGDYTGSRTVSFKIAVKKNAKYTVGTYTYKITNDNTAGKGTVMLTGAKNKNLKTAKIGETVSVGGKKFQITAIGDSAFAGNKKLTGVTIGKNVASIGKKAFKGCSKLKNITIKTVKLKAKTVGSQAFKGIHAKAVVKVPKKQKAAYSKWLKARGIGKKVKIK